MSLKTNNLSKQSTSDTSKKGDEVILETAFLFKIKFTSRNALY